jgi:predicted NBD/HSP70 family sugar kinase
VGPQRWSLSLLYSFTEEIYREGEQVVRPTTRGSGQLAVLRAVHARPGISRTAVAQQAGMSSGFTAETVGRLVALDLLAEQPLPATGARGRPTTALHPNPGGPLVVAVAVAHETWRVTVVELGGGRLETVEEPHRRDRAAVLAAITDRLGRVRRRFGSRVRAVAVAVPGTVTDDHLVVAPNLDWHQVDLTALWPRTAPGCRLVTGNDATFAAIAESRRGAAVGSDAMVHLFIDSGLGGAVIDGGSVLLGANGMAGEFGHMPFGDPALQCRCGAFGCWNTGLNGLALAELLGRPVPSDEVSFMRRVITAARAGAPGELGAVRAMGRSVGRGAAGLVNAFDPSVVTVGGLGRDLLAVAGADVTSAYLAGLMQFRAGAPPPVVPAHFLDDAPLVGAAEDGFATFLCDEGLAAWSSRVG